MKGFRKDTYVIPFEMYVYLINILYILSTLIFLQITEAATYIYSMWQHIHTYVKGIAS